MGILHIYMVTMNQKKLYGIINNRRNNKPLLLLLINTGTNDLATAASARVNDNFLMDNSCTCLTKQTKSGNVDGYWRINNGSLLCKPEPDGWLVWLRRVDGSVLFNQTWDEYVVGFGDPDGNYWLGLEKLHLLTGTGTKHKLRVEMGSWDHLYIEWAEYDDFSVGHKITNYTIHIQGFTGNTSYDSMAYDNGHSFSTYDNDNDKLPGHNCASMHGGGWGYVDCAVTLPTAKITHQKIRRSEHSYMLWYEAFGEGYHNLKSMTWKIRQH